jgi:superfamily II DNA/RNA helicase
MSYREHVNIFVCLIGLDIPTVQLIVNHNVPSNPKEYVHRVGRTARAGRGGFSLTLITPNDIKLLHAIEGRICKELKEFKIKGIYFCRQFLVNVTMS